MQDFHADLTESDSLRMWKFLQTLDIGIRPSIGASIEAFLYLLLNNIYFPTLEQHFTMEQILLLKLELITKVCFPILASDLKLATLTGILLHLQTHHQSLNFQDLPLFTTSCSLLY